MGSGPFALGTWATYHGAQHKRKPIVPPSAAVICIWLCFKIQSPAICSQSLVIPSPPSGLEAPGFCKAPQLFSVIRMRVLGYLSLGHEARYSWRDSSPMHGRCLHPYCSFPAVNGHASQILTHMPVLWASQSGLDLVLRSELLSVGLAFSTASE